MFRSTYLRVMRRIRSGAYHLLVWGVILAALLWAGTNNRPDIIISWLDYNLWLLKQLSALWPFGGQWLEAALRGSGFDRGVFVTVDAVCIRVVFWFVSLLWRAVRALNLKFKRPALSS